MTAQTQTLKYCKIVDQNTILPGSDNQFIEFYSPCLNNSDIVFYGNNMTYEGIFNVKIQTDLNAQQTENSINTISNNHTNLPGLDNNPPTTFNSTVGNFDAYSAASPDIAPIAYSSGAAPVIAINDDFITFFAADWKKDIRGIFSYSFNTKTINTLASSTQTPLTNYFFASPTNYLDRTYFAAECIDNTGNTTALGIYESNLASAEPSQVLNFLQTLTPSGNMLIELNNPKIYRSSFFFHATGNDEYGNIYRSEKTPSGHKLKSYLAPGQKLGGSGSYKIPTMAEYTFDRNISSSSDILVMQASLDETKNDGNGHGLIISQNDSEPMVIFASIGDTPEGDGLYTGNGFAFATDGVRVAYLPTYMSFKTSDTNVQELRVWNSVTGVSQRVLNTITPFDGKNKFTTLNFTTDSFHNGTLAITAEYYSEAQKSYTKGVFVLDLSMY